MIDRNFEAFKKYNKMLLATSPPLPTDPFLDLKKKQYKALEPEQKRKKTVFDRLTKTNRTDRTNSSSVSPKVRINFKRRLGNRSSALQLHEQFIQSAGTPPPIHPFTSKDVTLYSKRLPPKLPPPIFSSMLSNANSLDDRIFLPEVMSNQLNAPSTTVAQAQAFLQKRPKSRNRLALHLGETESFEHPKVSNRNMKTLSQTQENFNSPRHIPATT